MFRKLFSTASSLEHTEILSEIEKMYYKAPVDFGGGCSFQKALTLALFIKEFNLKSSADIGVYRGRSLFPQAIAHKKFTSGIAYAIDPYSNAAAVQKDKPEIQEKLDEFARTTDFETIFSDVTAIVEENQLTPFCRFIRMKSHDAKNFFRAEKISLGLVHIDGNHDTFFVMQDVEDYLPIIPEGGIIVLDDISWDSVKPAMTALAGKCSLVGTLVDNQNDFAVFVNSKEPEKIKQAEKIFDKVKKHRYSKK